MDVLEGLNPEQCRAAETVRGPVCILAGAGSGKTTTITRRIAHQVACGAFRADQILAVTFTDKAAGEMRARLAALGVEGVRASTFHSAALGQLRRYSPDPPAKILASKAPLLRAIGNRLPGAYRFRPAADLATEVEWAKNRRLTPSTYLDGLGEHEPPIPPDLMRRVLRDYEGGKAAQGALDFEDLLELAVRQLDEAHVAADVRERYLAFTVDEYQDVNLLQQSLLERWLGVRDDICVVGDDYQSIYAFTGASPRWLLDLPRRLPHATVVRLERNYRSTPDVLELANGLVPKLGGAQKTLVATRPAGPVPELRRCHDPVDEARLVVERVRALHAEGVPLEHMAVLTRTNARTVEFEEAFHEAALPFQGSSLLERDAARGLLKRLARAEGGRLADLVRRTAAEQGWLDPVPERLGERELTRQQDLARLVRLADELDDGALSAVGFVEELKRRFGTTAGDGVHLLTLHRAKGLEFDAVFLPRLEDGELPIRRARGGEALQEERRLLYVGITRARRWLLVTWSGRPSRFLAELGVERRAEPNRIAEDDLPPAFAALRTWRLERAKADEVPAYVVFHNSTLAEIAERQPRTLAELARVPGVGPAKLERYGSDVLAALSAVA